MTNTATTITHTTADTAAITAAGLRMDVTAPREWNAVPCQSFGCRNTTRNVMGWCDCHYHAPTVVARKLTELGIHIDDLNLR